MRTRWHQSRPGFLAVTMLTLLSQISCSSEGSPRAASLRAADDHLIVPGTRIGPFKLGMTDQELFQVGTPSGTRTIAGTWSTYWFNDRVVYVNLQSRRVERVFTESRSDRTSSGVGVGSSLEDLFRALGPPDETVEGDESCGVLGRVSHVLYQSGNMWVSFFKDGANCTQAPTKRVQFLMIKTAGSAFSG
jgi:hypothetical protein